MMEYRKLPTGYERTMPDGRTIQAHWRDDPEWARELLERIDVAEAEGKDG
ncbi:hypothetical protein [Sphingomonas sp. TX0522]|nr:hypothetical protein [Sphingomonas sp. TX0522]